MYGDNEYKIATLRTIVDRVRPLTAKREALRQEVAALAQQIQQRCDQLDALEEKMRLAVDENAAKCEWGYASLNDIKAAERVMTEYKTVAANQKSDEQQQISLVLLYQRIGKTIEAARQQFNTIISSIDMTGETVGRQRGADGNRNPGDIMAEIYKTGDTTIIAIAEKIRTCNAPTRHVVWSIFG
jgi:hypothetical protein